MGTLTIRAFEWSEHDYEGYASLRRMAWPDDPTSVEALRDWDARWGEDRFRRRYVAMDPDTHGSINGVVQLSSMLFSDDPRRFRILMFAHPSYEVRGVRDLLYRSVVDDLARDHPDAVSIEGYAMETEPEAIAWYERRGYRKTLIERFSRLDTAAFEEHRFAATIASVEGSGIAITDLGSLLSRDRGALVAAHALANELTRDVPANERMTLPPFDEWRRLFVDTREFLPGAYILALDHGRMVGQSQIVADLSTDELYRTDLTGTLRPYRRRGIATAMKVRAIGEIRGRTAASGKAPIIETDNAVENPMYQLNLRLGFVPRPAMVIYLREDPLGRSRSEGPAGSACG